MVDINYLTVVVLSGGQGTRIRAIHPSVPKSMIDVLGKPFLYWLTLWISNYGPKNFIYATGYLSEKIESWVKQSIDISLNRQCCVEHTPLGTAGAVINCLPFCREWILVVNGDSLLIDGLDRLLYEKKFENENGVLLGVYMKNTDRYGRLSISSDNYLFRFEEKKSGAGLINSGIYLFRKSYLETFVNAKSIHSMEYDLFPTILAKGDQLKVMIVDTNSFLDIGTPESLAQADAFIKKNFSKDQKKKKIVEF